jgi:membrane protein implicated in regulation of membrane protease activity
MNWPDFYLFCFLVGFFFSLASLLSGHIHLDGHGHGFHGHHGGHVGHADAGHHSGSHAHAHDTGRQELSAFNMGTIAAFLAWFGGTGYLATHFYRVWFLSALGLSVAAGLVGAGMLFWFVSRVLMRDREELDPATFEMVGVLGTVCGTVREGGIGEIVFSQNGLRRSAAVRSEDGSAIPTGVEVVVTEYRDGIAYVRRWDELTQARHLS